MFHYCRVQSKGSVISRGFPTLALDDSWSSHKRWQIHSFSTSLRGLASSNQVPREGRKSTAKQRQQAERHELTRLLKASPGKRDAKNFLKYFDSADPSMVTNSQQVTKESVKKAHHDDWRLAKTGVNLGSLYEPTKAALNNPTFTQQVNPQRGTHEPLHLALVKLRQPQNLDHTSLTGIALTLSQMAKLGLNIAVVIDCEDDHGADYQKHDSTFSFLESRQVARFVDALSEFNEPGAFAVDHALGLPHVAPTEIRKTQDNARVEVDNSHLLFSPLDDGIIPVLSPLAYDAHMKAVRVDADDVVLALTRLFAGVGRQSIQAGVMNESKDLAGIRRTLHDGRPVLDRIIILDPLGGIPSKSRADGAHVFVNLEAEYRDVLQEIEGSARISSKTTSNDKKSLGAFRPLSRSVEDEVAALPGEQQKHVPSMQVARRHQSNLKLTREALRLLPPTSSALIITPDEAAISSQLAVPEGSSPGVRTRRSKNPLIHNLLTDKPMISSSLPDPLVTRHLDSVAPSPATFLKKGIPITMIPDPRISGPWSPPGPLDASIELENDPSINFPRLVDLIEDSFRRKLDVKDYLDRVRGRIAGVIIAGDYEGGAICTWEKAMPHSCSSLSNGASPWVPYLDKFAVLSASQGSGGVADIVWGALTRSAFPDGLVWRSRKTNPVNKWYFERSVGMWNLPDGYWTMFWTTEGVVEEWAVKSAQQGKGAAEGDQCVQSMDTTRWEAYVDVCAGVRPSWADGNTPD